MSVVKTGWLEDELNQTYYVAVYKDRRTGETIRRGFYKDESYAQRHADGVFDRYELISIDEWRFKCQT